MRADHELDLALVRHHGLEAEALLPPQAGFPLEIGDLLRLLGAQRFGQIERLRDFVGIDISADIDTGIEQRFRECALARSVRTGDDDEKRRLGQSAALSRPRPVPGGISAGATLA